MTAINETLTAKGYTPAASVPQVFGRARTIDGIVIHHWGALGQTHDGVVNFFVNGPGETSAHFVASAGRINCLVSPLDAAWHSGNAVGNATTIGIECRPEATDADYATVAELVAWLRAEYGPLPLTPHKQWQSTACPGVWNLARIDALASASTVVPQSTGTPSKGALMALSDKEQNELLAGVRTLLARTADIKTSGGNVSVRQMIADGTRAAQAAESNTGPITRGGKAVPLRQEVADIKTKLQA
jgi:hypothetical protein